MTPGKHPVAAVDSMHHPLPAVARLAEALDRDCRGEVLTVAEDGFDQAVVGHNHTLVHQPDVVVQAADANDVTAAVRAAARYGARVQVQSTGHGPSQVTRGGILVRTGALDDIDIDPATRTARVGAGVCWGDLVAACADHGLAPLGMASAASVGVAGYLLGGGMGPLGRTEGFGADHVLAVEMVDATGRMCGVDAEHHADLFWTVRGGRLVPGVVTAFTLELREVPQLFAATVTYDRADVPAALAEYAAWQQPLPDATTSTAGLLRFPDAPDLPQRVRGRRFLQVGIVHIGDESSGRATVDRLTDMGTPAAVEAAVTDPAGWLRSQPPIPPGPSWQRGMLLNRFDSEVAEVAVRAAGPEVDAPWQVVEVRPTGGALARRPRVANAVGGRSDGVILSVVAPTANGSGALATAHARLAERMCPWVIPGLHVNFHGLEDANHPLSRAWPASTCDELADVRATYDPTGLFPTPTLTA